MPDHRVTIDRHQRYRQYARLPQRRDNELLSVVGVRCVAESRQRDGFNGSGVPGCLRSYGDFHPEEDFSLQTGIDRARRFELASERTKEVNLTLMWSVRYTVDEPFDDRIEPLLIECVSAVDAKLGDEIAPDLGHDLVGVARVLVPGTRHNQCRPRSDG